MSIFTILCSSLSYPLFSFLLQHKKWGSLPHLVDGDLSLKSFISRLDLSGHHHYQMHRHQLHIRRQRQTFLHFSHVESWMRMPITNIFSFIPPLIYKPIGGEKKNCGWMKKGLETKTQKRKEEDKWMMRGEKKIKRKKKREGYVWIKLKI